MVKNDRRDDCLNVRKIRRGRYPIGKYVNGHPRIYHLSNCLCLLPSLCIQEGPEIFIEVREGSLILLFNVDFRTGDTNPGGNPHNFEPAHWSGSYIDIQFESPEFNRRSTSSRLPWRNSRLYHVLSCWFLNLPLAPQILLLLQAHKGGGG